MHHNVPLAPGPEHYGSPADERATDVLNLSGNAGNVDQQPTNPANYHQEYFPAGMHRLGAQAVQAAEAAIVPTPDGQPTEHSTGDFIGSPEHSVVSDVCARLEEVSGLARWRYHGHRPAEDSVLMLAGQRLSVVERLQHRVANLRHRGSSLDITALERAFAAGDRVAVTEQYAVFDAAASAALRETMRTGVMFQERPDLTLGGSVKVRRSPTATHPDGHVEDGWTLRDVDAQGRLLASIAVQTPHGMQTYYKTISRGQLLDTNPPPTTRS